MKYHLITYGCQMNTADSEEMAQPLKERGLVSTADPKEADIIIMNTCTVREQAEHRAQSNLGRMAEWKAEKADRILIVAGCAASRWGSSIQKRYPYIDAVSPATRIEQFPDLISQVLKEKWNWESETTLGFGASEDRGVGEEETGVGVEGSGGRGVGVTAPNLQYPDIPTLSTPTPSTPTHPTLFGDEKTAYVTIMRGCNYTCTYCIVPQVRGRESYRPMPEILSEIELKASQGKREVMLLGQTVNSYHYREEAVSESRRTGEPETSQNSNLISPAPQLSDSPARPYDFADLLRAVNALPGVERIRFMSPHPKHLRDRVIDAMAESPKVCRHLHLPVQSGSNTMLAAMHRFYTREDYQTITQKLRERMPGLLLTTDLIVGFPGESEEDHEQTLAFMKAISFDGVFAFKYSPRPGTAAAVLADDVLDSLKEKRLQDVLALNQSIVRAKGQSSRLWAEA